MQAKDAADVRANRARGCARVLCARAKRRKSAKRAMMFDKQRRLIPSCPTHHVTRSDVAHHEPRNHALSPSDIFIIIYPPAWLSMRDTRGKRECRQNARTRYSAADAPRRRHRAADAHATQHPAIQPEQQRSAALNITRCCQAMAVCAGSARRSRQTARTSACVCSKKTTRGAELLIERCACVRANRSTVRAQCRRGKKREVRRGAI